MTNKHTVQHRQYKVERRKVCSKQFFILFCSVCPLYAVYARSFMTFPFMMWAERNSEKRIGNKKRREKKCFFFVRKKHIADLKHQMFICVSVTKAGKNGTFLNIVSREIWRQFHSIDNNLNAFQIPKPNRNFEWLFSLSPNNHSSIGRGRAIPFVLIFFFGLSLIILD